MASDHVDVLIVGAGLSGIGAACHLRRTAPTRRTRCSRRATPSAAPGTCSATRASAPTRTCSPSATRSSRGPRRRPSPTATTIRRLRAGDRPASTASPQHIRFRHRVLRADWDSDDRPLDGARPAHRHRRDRGADLLLPLRLRRLLPLRRGLHARPLPGVEALRRAAGAPAALARRPRPHRQAGGGDRQRRHGGDPGAGDGAAGRARDHAPALTDVRHGAARPRPRWPTRCGAGCRRRPRIRWCAGRTCCCPPSTSSSAGVRPAW